MRERKTARVLLFDGSGRILLVSATGGPVRDPAGGPRSGTPFWFTPGGEIEDGETIHAAARRELAEETGIVDAELGPIVWYGEQTLLLRDEPVRFQESFLVARTHTTALSRSGWQDEESLSLTGLRWWTADELRASRELIFPSLLVSRAGQLHALLEETGATDEPEIEHIDLR